MNVLYKNIAHNELRCKDKFISKIKCTKSFIVDCIFSWDVEEAVSQESLLELSFDSDLHEQVSPPLQQLLESSLFP